MQHYQLYQEKIKYFIDLIGTIFLLTINMCDRGRMITHLQISRFHTQVWYYSHYTNHCVNVRVSYLMSFVSWKSSSYLNFSCTATETGDKFDID